MALVPNLVNIGGTETFLAGGQTPMGGGLLAGEVGLELDHACTGEKQSGVSLRHQRGTGHHQVPISSKEIEERFSYLSAGYGPDHVSDPSEGVIWKFYGNSPSMSNLDEPSVLG